MLINTEKNIALVGEDKYDNPEGLYLYDISSKEKKYIKEYASYTPYDLSTDGRFALLASKGIIYKGTNRNHVIVLNLETKDVVYSTKDYYINNLLFSAKADKILFDTSKKKAFFIDITTLKKSEVSKGNLRIYQGYLDKERESFFFPSVVKKKTLY